ncbi:MAG TPA: hypothetical protein ENI76_01270 [Ignavibacteria bacterium]|nr:hypothetical protein [Ignavibacteria bacterium]
MESKKIIILLLLFSLVMASFGSALTGRIGNAKAILDADVGDTIDRTIKVINSNNESVIIELFSSGDLADDINILDNNFTLKAGEEKKARFKIYVSKGGTTKSNVNVKFSPLGDGNGVGMTSTIIIKAGEKSLLDSIFKNKEDTSKENTVSIKNGNKGRGDESSITGNVIGGDGINVTTIIIALLIIAFIFLIAIVMVLIFRKKSTKRKEEMI